MFSRIQLAALALGLSLGAGLAALGGILGYSALKHKEFERTVTVKGLSEREYPADSVIWTIDFTLANNSLLQLHGDLENGVQSLITYLTEQGIEEDDISTSTPSINDSFTNQYRDANDRTLRYTGNRSVTVYSDAVDLLREVMQNLASAGLEGGFQIEGSWWSHAQYSFESLNEVKPGMVEEATRNARDVAIKFAEDSDSRLGRIRQASQGQFSIRDRDATNPHIKRVRVVSTVEYYLVD
ncbi:MAG: SIMPL domain-containing protein [Proteobacteria bacterium]|nr:SIMPL domain-containing protein [Pseudomonadota bacterium]